MSEVEVATRSLTIAELIDQAYQTAKAKGWHNTPRSFGEMMALLHSEVSEALEAYRDGEFIAAHTYEDTPQGPKPTGIPSELADIVIRVADLCGLHRIDLERALREKLAYNANRPHRHGNKVL